MTAQPVTPRRGLRRGQPRPRRERTLSLALAELEHRARQLTPPPATDADRHRPIRPGPFTAADLQEVAGQLLHATLTLPRPPYTTPQVQADEPVEPSSV